MSVEFRRWRVGRVTITRMVEIGPVPIPPETLFPSASADLVKSTDWLAPNFATDSGEIMLNFQCFLVDTGATKILVDTCVGEQKHLAVDILDGLTTGFLDTLAQAGAGPDDIDIVL